MACVQPPGIHKNLRGAFFFFFISKCDFYDDVPQWGDNTMIMRNITQIDTDEKNSTNKDNKSTWIEQVFEKVIYVKSA